MPQLICWSILLLLIIVFLVWLVQKCRTYLQNRIFCDMECAEGHFHARGRRSRFVIKKNKRYLFKIENGQIVSVTIRNGFKSQTIPYQSEVK